MLLTYIIKITTNKKFKYLKYALLQKKVRNVCNAI